MNYLSHLRKDVPAGLVVFLVALPLCMGIALASGAPMMSGIISGIIGGLIVGFLSGSQLSVSGPAAGLTIIVFEAIQGLGFETFLLSVVIAGVFQLLLGVIKAGFISHYFPLSVIKGMLSAIGLILILKQLPHMMGVDQDAFGEMQFLQADGHNTFSYLFYAIGQTHWGALIIGAICLFQLWLWERPFFKEHKVLGSIPAALVTVLLGVVVNELYALIWDKGFLELSHRVQLPSIQEEGGWLSVLRYPDFSSLGNKQVYITAVSISIIASLETLLSLEAVDKIDPLRRKSPQNRELRAQGIGNILCGFLGGLPMTAVIVRSSANMAAGGRTKLSAIMHGFFLLVAVWTIPSALMHIPLASLAAILVMVGFKLTKPILYSDQWKLGKDQFIPFLITIFAILLTDLLIGVIVGLAVGLFFVLRAHQQNSFELTRREKEKGDGMEVRIRLSQHMSFLNKAELSKELHDIPMHSHVTIDGKLTQSIDHDVQELLNSFKHQAREKRIDLQIIDIPELTS